MGQCTSKADSSSSKSGAFNQMKKSDRQLRSGVKFKDIEFGGFIGYSTTINDVYTPSGVSVASVPKEAEQASLPQIESVPSEPLIPK